MFAVPGSRRSLVAVTRGLNAAELLLAAGEGKTDAKDPFVIAETARIRRDLPVIGPRPAHVRPAFTSRLSARQRTRHAPWAC